MSTLTSLLLWLDALPARYWGLVYVTTAAVVLSALAAYFRPTTIQRWNRPWLFAALIPIAILAFRWPMVFDNRQLNNPDESQMIAGAIVLQTDPIFWKSVDGTTHGPLVQLPLAALGALGMRLDFTNARLVSTGLLATMLICAWLTLRVPFGDGMARILILPAVVFVISTQFWDFGQYSSEHVPIVLIAVATWLIAISAIEHRRGQHWQLGVAGLTLGAIPFAKLQGIPLGIWIGAAGLLLILGDTTIEWRVKRTRAVWLVAGTLVVPVAFFCMIAINGLWHDFWVSYIETNLFYTATFPLSWRDAPKFFLSLDRAADEFPQYFDPVAGILLIGTVPMLFFGRRRHLRLVAFTIGLFAASLYATIAPHRTFTHYLQFTIGPLILAAGAVTGSVVQSWKAHQRLKASHVRVLGAGLVLLYLAIGTGFLVGQYKPREPAHVGRYSATRGKLVRSSLAEFVVNTTRRTESVAIWGWQPRYFVEANRRHATREAHSALELFESPFRDYYRSRYLADFIRSEPALFADLTGPGSFFFVDRKRHAHETFPALAKLITDRYRLVAEMDGARIYLRKDRPYHPPAQ